MDDVVKCFQVVNTKQKPLTMNQLKSMEWLILSTFQLELDKPYNLLARYFADIGQLEVFHKIIDRIDIADDGIYFLTPPP